MTDLKLGIVFDVKNGRFKSEVKENTQVIDKFGHSAQRTAGQTRQFNAAIDDTNTKLFQTNKVASSVKNAIAGLAVGFGAIELGKGLVTELAAFQDIRTRLQGLSDDAADYAEKERWLIDLATEHHKELNGLADGYSRLSTLTQEKIITDGQARDMLQGLSDAASRNGASNADLERVYYGLSQALGAGTVNMEDFRQVTEPLPDLMAKIAKAAGQETSSGLKELIATGTYTSEVFGKHLVSALQQYEGAAAETADNINAKYRDIKREYQLLSVELEQPINGALLPTLDGLASGLSFLKDHAQAVITILQGGLVIAAGHATNAIIAKTSATAKNIIATRISTQAAMLQAQSEYNLAVAYKASAVGSVQNALADKRLIASKTVLTAATNKANFALRAGGGAMALLGGPVGVAMLAAFAVGTYAMSAADGARESTNLANKVSLANKKLTELTTKQLRLRLFELENDPAAEIDKARLKALKAQEEYNKVQATRGFKNPNKETEETVLNRDVEIEALELKLSKITALKTQISTLLAKPSEGQRPEVPATQSGKVLDVFKDQEGALKRQLSLLGKTSELAKAEYETQLGKYKDLLPGQKASIVNIAKEIDTKKESLAADKQALQQSEQLQQSAQSYAETLQRKVSLSGEVTNVQQLAFELEHGSLVGINDQLKEQLMLKAELADRVEADTEKQLSFWEQMNEHIASTTENFDVMWGNSFDRFAQGIGDATATSIMEGQSFSDAMKNIGRSVIKEVISGIVQIGVKKLALFAIEKAINKGTAISAATFMSANASATAMQAGLATFASISAIPVLGPAAAPGAMTAALAVATPMAGAITAASAGMAGMAHDGIDEIPREGTWLLDKGERVVDSRTNQDLKQALNKGSVGSGSGTVIHITNHNTFEGNNNPDDIESVMALSTEKMRADLYEDFSTGGPLTEQLKAAM
ncbi:tape measure protein [Colwellia psychrerythraea]|uniref:Phage tape measure protein n=1 Tax=Colwellia psychrerythraea TaxID=28229 RepID=A0A099K830_COLPS|nr:tape measure domain-containing protein [Colwellia psychrerythraea]KGJ86450.1 phage tape measure protein [Colwellia psychrerythraea]